MYVHKINSSSCLGFTLNKQQSVEKLVARQYMYLMDRSSLEKIVGNDYRQRTSLSSRTD
jgi:hypothetical protein